MSNSNYKGGGGEGPCGACKFLRRKCVKGCVFAPYFDSEEGTSQFAAVHKVFGASNASKLLSAIPQQDRVDAVLTLSYEALARVRDPVYGCVSQLFALQHQVVNLQAELAYIQARLAILRKFQPVSRFGQNPSQVPPVIATSTNTESEQQTLPAFELTSSFPTSLAEEALDDASLQCLAQEFISRYLPPGVSYKSSSASSS